MKRDPASSNGRTPPFEGVNRGSTPRAGTSGPRGDEIKRLKATIELLTAELEEAHLVAHDNYHAGFMSGQLAKIRDVRLRGRSK